MMLSESTKRVVDITAPVATTVSTAAALTVGQQIVLVISGIAGVLSILWYLTRFYEWLRGGDGDL